MRELHVGVPQPQQYNTRPQLRRRSGLASGPHALTNPAPRPPPPPPPQFINQGKATIRLVQQRTQILLSGAEPEELSAFMKFFLCKLEARKQDAASGQSREITPKCSSIYDTPGDITAISPLSSASRANCPRTSKRKIVDEPEMSPTKRARLVEQLSEEQNGVFNKILGGNSIFFTGSAGTGKSYLLKKILKALPAAGTYITASTGIAACHVSGTTLHTFAGFKQGSGKLPRNVQS